MMEIDSNNNDNAKLYRSIKNIRKQTLAVKIYKEWKNNFEHLLVETCDDKNQENVTDTDTYEIVENMIERIKYQGTWRLPLKNVRKPLGVHRLVAKIWNEETMADE